MKPEDAGSGGAMKPEDAGSGAKDPSGTEDQITLPGMDSPVPRSALADYEKQFEAKIRDRVYGETLGRLNDRVFGVKNIEEGQRLINLGRSLDQMGLSTEQLAELVEKQAAPDNGADEGGGQAKITDAPEYQKLKAELNKQLETAKETAQRFRSQAMKEQLFALWAKNGGRADGDDSTPATFGISALLESGDFDVDDDYRLITASGSDPNEKVAAFLKANSFYLDDTKQKAGLPNVPGGAGLPRDNGKKGESDSRKAMSQFLAG